LYIYIIAVSLLALSPRAAQGEPIGEYALEDTEEAGVCSVGVEVPKKIDEHVEETVGLRYQELQEAQEREHDERLGIEN